MSRLACTLGLALMATTLLPAQPSLPPSPRNVRIHLPEGVPHEAATIMYFLYGAFGAQGTVLALEKQQAFANILIPAGATGLKLAAYFPGCEYATLEIPLENAGVAADLPCRVLGTRRLHGHIANVAALGDFPSEVHADLSTIWMCRLFELPDCMTPVIRVATAEVRNGEFILDVPDLRHFQSKRGLFGHRARSLLPGGRRDSTPVPSVYSVSENASGRQDGADSVGFDVRLDQPAIKRTATLAPVEGSRHTSGMMVLPSFEADMVFEAVELRINGEEQPAVR